MDINAEVLFRTDDADTSFSVQVASVIFMEMSAIWHQFRLVFLRHLSFAYSFTV